MPRNLNDASSFYIVSDGIGAEHMILWRCSMTLPLLTPVPCNAIAGHFATFSLLQCCESTCVAGSEYPCGDNGYNCLEPNVNELYGFETPPPAPPCSADAQRAWVVNNSTQVQLLAAAINCSGGSFEVEWEGTVALDEPLLVTDGTVLQVTGDGSTAVVDGNGTSRAFTVINAVLHVSGVNISLGASTIGGGIAAAGASLVFNSTHFHGNSASREGGALWLSNSNASWSGSTFFVGNSAQAGGAVFVLNGTYIDGTGDAEFSSNVAKLDGGAIGSVASNTLSSPKDSSLSITGRTTFFDNAAQANGGALALLGGLSVSFSGFADIEFVNNTADVGGAIYLSSTVVGPTFSGVSFVSNSAQVGGAVSAVRSGSLKAPDDTQASPVTFNGCLFVGNKAESLGGAVRSAAGHDTFTRSVFRGNSAGTGGALRLEGMASIDGCQFEENASGAGEGAAVSNIGEIDNLKDISFSGNMFDCQPNTYLEYNVRRTDM